MCALRVAAILTALIGAGWFLLGARLPFAFSSQWALAFGVLALTTWVFVAAGSARAEGRFASVGLWLVQGGIAMLIATFAFESWLHRSRGVGNVIVIRAVDHGWFAVLGLLSLAAVLGLAGGALLWLCSRYLDRRHRG
jgi:hypothetical protein